MFTVWDSLFQILRYRCGLIGFSQVFALKKRRIFLVYFLPLAAVVLCAGCATHSEKKQAANGDDKPLEVENKKETGVPWQQSLGRVALVNKAQEFVLVEVGTAPVPESGTPLRSYSNAELSAELVVSRQHRRPFMIADIMSGTPRVGDSIVVMGRKLPEVQSPEAQATRKVMSEPSLSGGVVYRPAPRVEAPEEFDAAAAQVAEEEIRLVYDASKRIRTPQAPSGAAESGSAKPKADASPDTSSGGEGDIIPGMQRLRKGGK